MNLATSRSQISLRFRIEDDVAGTLENVLAIVRRVGAELCKLRAGLGTHGLEVWMRLSAEEADILRLCQTRLENCIGVADIFVSAEANGDFTAATAQNEPVALYA